MESPVKSILTRTSPRSYLVALKPTSCSYLKMYFFKEKKKMLLLSTDTKLEEIFQEFVSNMYMFRNNVYEH